MRNVTISNRRRLNIGCVPILNNFEIHHNSNTFECKLWSHWNDNEWEFPYGPYWSNNDYPFPVYTTQDLSSDSGYGLFYAIWRDPGDCHRRDMKIYECQYVIIPPPTPSPGPSPTPTPSPGWGCFPEGTIVNTSNGEKMIKDLNIGDQVLTINRYTRNSQYSDVYMHGHKMKDIVADFITLYTNNTNFTISATTDHFIYICDNYECNWQNTILKRFGNVIPGKDNIFDYKMNKYLVIRKEIERKQGLYNPYTLNGNIVVNNIITSCHSEWILDDMFNDKYEGYLPEIYQILFVPLRWFYSYTPIAWKLFNSLYPYGLNDVENHTIFDIIKQAYYCLFVQSS